MDSGFALVKADARSTPVSKACRDKKWAKSQLNVKSKVVSYTKLTLRPSC